MSPNINYYYNEDYLKDPDWVREYEKICTYLKNLKQSGKIKEFTILTHGEAFPTEESKRQFLESLRKFSTRHHVGLAQIFGSRRQGFWYLPTQFLLVYENKALKEVFPCKSGDNEIDIVDFLEKLQKGEPWTLWTTTFKKKGLHKELLERIIKNPQSLELGLRLIGKNVLVSRGFGERGYVDLVFEDKNGLYLLVEVKGKSDEIDKAIGQIMRHRILFTEQNFIKKERIRMAIICPFIIRQSRIACEDAGIQCFEVSKMEGFLKKN